MRCSGVVCFGDLKNHLPLHRRATERWLLSPFALQEQESHQKPLNAQLQQLAPATYHVVATEPGGHTTFDSTLFSSTYGVSIMMTPLDSCASERPGAVSSTLLGLTPNPQDQLRPATTPDQDATPTTTEDNSTASATGKRPLSPASEPLNAPPSPKRLYTSASQAADRLLGPLTSWNIMGDDTLFTLVQVPKAHHADG
ncbi:hypothetical protein ACJZ2D_006609 [Fusarium nematophilum]